MFDFARRHRGYLILFPVEDDEVYGPVIERVLRVIQCCAGKPVPPVEIDLDWICSPQDQRSRAFNEGFLQPPSISFAACSMGMGMEEKSVPDRRSIYERVSLACQSALKRCKLQRQRVIIQKAEPVAVDTYLTYQPAGMLEINSALRWSSERYLRETLYFQQLDQPVLFQFNPVYRSTSTWFASMMVDEALAMEKYRGNKYGVGLKGINEIFGHNAATRLIGELMGVFSKTMQATLVDRRLPTERIHIARFVDRFTICCEQPYLELPGIIELVQRLSRLFNCLSEEIKISHLRTSVVFGEDCSVGYRLFQQLAHVSLSSQATAVENSDPPIEVRQSRFASCEEQERITLERNSFLSANLLDSYL